MGFFHFAPLAILARRSFSWAALSGKSSERNDLDTTGARLNGAHRYTVTFAKDQTPPVNGFRSLTMHNEEHFFVPNEIGHYSVDTNDLRSSGRADRPASARELGCRRARVLAQDAGHRRFVDASRGRTAAIAVSARSTKSTCHRQPRPLAKSPSLGGMLRPRQTSDTGFANGSVALTRSSASHECALPDATRE